MPQVLAPIAAAFTAFKGTALFAFLGTTTGRLLASVALSVLQTALIDKPSPPGIETEFTTSGGINPLSFVLGTYATAGNAASPPMSHGLVGYSTGNLMLTYVIDLGDVPGHTLQRLIVDGQYVDIGTTPHALYGLPLQGPFVGRGWIQYYDGTQTAADPTLLTIYGAYPERPWLSDMVGTGTCYAVLTFRYNPEVYAGLPEVRFEMGGIPVYDPREDSTVGGSGSQTWADPTSWAFSDNPMVLIYNILRGITVPDVGVWGGKCDAADLPLTAWFAAMNECDVAVPLDAGGTEPAFRAGAEVLVDQTPAEIIEALLAACTGQLAEVGGVWKPRVGGPGLPVMFFTDDDVVVSRSQEFRPFPGLENRFNAVTATYPEPASLWEPKDAPPLYNTGWEAEDGERRLEKALTLSAVPYPNQVQRVMRASIAAGRRFRQHSLVLPPDAAILEPLDAASWTSARHQYTAKGFECFEVADDQLRLLQALVIHERDASDHVWDTAFEMPWSVPSTVTVVPDPLVLVDFDAVAHVIEDGSANARRPAILATWDGTDQDGIRGVEIEVRLAAGAVISTQSSSDVTSGEMVLSAGLVDNTAYEVRGRPVMDGPADWSAWVAVSTDDRRFGQIDLNGDQLQQILLGPTTVTGGTTIMTLAMGAMSPGNIWQLGIVFEARYRTASGSYDFRLQSRSKYAGSWSSWQDVYTWTFGRSDTAWAMRSQSRSIAGAFEDMEFRVFLAASSTQTDALRNIYLTIVNLAK